MTDIQKLYNQLLENLSKELDIPPSKYQQAVERYRAVGMWLEEGSYDHHIDKPEIYPQGSFRLGTVVRPIKNGEEADYDIDLVCCLPTLKNSITPRKLKSLIGDRLKENANYKRMLDDEGRRCWTLNYAEQDGIGFHIDVLPAVPEDKQIIGIISVNVPSQYASQAIAITNKDERNEYSWFSSNPKGYADWFDQIKKPALDRIQRAEKQILFENNRSLFANIDDVPIELVKTPLQRVIQILKRHRDIRFTGDDLEEDKPISMIITTLSARLYQNEGDVYLTLKNIVDKLVGHEGLLQPGTQIEKSISDLKIISKNPDGTWYIPNPVNPTENFADRWHENNNRKAKAFFKWVAWVRSDLIDILAQTDIRQVSKSLEGNFGEKLIKEAMAHLGQVAVAATNNFHANIPTVEIKPSKPWGHGNES
jgi:hypothetical protein